MLLLYPDFGKRMSTYDMVGLHASTKRANDAEESVDSAAMSFRMPSTSSRKRRVKCFASIWSPSVSSSPKELAVVKGLEAQILVYWSS